MFRALNRHLGKLGCVRSDPYEPTSTGFPGGRYSVVELRTFADGDVYTLNAWPRVGLRSDGFSGEIERGS